VPSPARSHPLVAFREVSKTYANGVTALSGVSFSVNAGACHAICGENGAGKSTLMKCLYGFETPSAGVIEIDGRPTGESYSPRAASAAGIGMVHQHFSLIPSFTVAENVSLGREPVRGGLVDRMAARAEVRRLAERFRLPVDPDARVGAMSVAAQQKVEILKALARDIRLLILDEPTAVLTPQETEELFERLRHLRAEGLTIIFISHKLREVQALADHVTVLRGGRLAGDAAAQDMDEATMARLVMGQDVKPVRRDKPSGLGPEILQVDGLSLAAPDPADRLDGISFVLHAGEILGVAGVDGNGQRGLVSALTGRARPDAGGGAFLGRAIGRLDTRDWRRAGLAHLPADRFAEGGARNLSLADNAIGCAYRSPDLGRWPLLSRAKAAALTTTLVSEYGVRAVSPRQPLGSLSGGNAQKLIAAREFETKPRLLIVDQPTRGIDVQAAAFIRARLVELAEAGTAVLLVTADLDELLSLSDRVLVLYGGRIVARLENGPGLTSEALGPYMLGLRSAA
jgi:simple sugar transport system ATP-binding protein